MPVALDERAVQTALGEPTAWPNLSQAAALTGLSKGMLSKQAHAGKIASEVRGFGRGERVLPPDEVLRIGYSYRRMPQSMLIERLAQFLGGRLSVDTDLMQRVLRNIVETAGQGQSQALKEDSMVNGAPAQETNSTATTDGTPKWLLEVERLRGNPAALAGTLSFTTADDLIGALELGPSVDEPAGTDPVAW